VRKVGGELKLVAESPTPYEVLEPGPNVEITAFVTRIMITV
jgi:hypothetical protein